MIRSEKELTTKIADCTTSFDAKFAGTNGKRAIVICGGTGCLSSCLLYTSPSPRDRG